MKFKLLKAKSPIKKNIAANLFGVCVNLLNQIALVPLYIIFWGNDLYADWIVLSAITVIFSMSDIGLNTVIQNRFSIKLSQNNNSECNSLLTNNFIIVSFIFSLSLIGISLYLYFVDIVSSFGLHSISRNEAGCILVLIVVRIYLGMYSGIENAIYKATHNNSRCVYIDQFSALTTVIITALCLFLHLRLSTMCILLCIPPIIVILFKRIDSKKYYDYKFSLRNVDKNLLKTLLKPAVAFLSFPIGNAFLLQGFTFIINKYFGANDVVSYNTTRTMCNFIIILLGTIQTSVWPEYSIAFGKQDFQRMRILHSKALTITFIGAFLCSLVIMILGPIIYLYWTNGHVSFSYSLMSVFLISIILNMLWSASGVTLLSTNNHLVMGRIYMLGTCISFCFAWTSASLGLSMVYIALFLLPVHVFLDIYTIKASLKLTHDNFTSLIFRNVRFLQKKRL